MDPSMSMAEAARLRARADELRRLAAGIEGADVMTLDRLAGESTWRGPGPELCERLLATNQHQLRLAAEELRRRSGLLEQTARELEAAAATLGATGPG